MDNSGVIDMQVGEVQRLTCVKMRYQEDVGSGMTSQKGLVYLCAYTSYLNVAYVKHIYGVQSDAFRRLHAHIQHLHWMLPKTVRTGA